MEQKGEVSRMPEWISKGWTEYLLFAGLPMHIETKIEEERKIFLDEYGSKGKSIRWPGIVVASFLSRESMEEMLIKWIQRICGMHHEFIAALNNYSGFPSHTIYLRVQDHQPFRQLTDQMKVVDEFLQSSGCPQTRLVAKPHVVLVKQIPPSVYSRAMMDYSQKTFYETFRVEELQLVRKMNQHDEGRIVNRFRFLPEAAFAGQDH